MKYLFFPLILFCLVVFRAGAQQKGEPWKPSQLMATKALADRITAGKPDLLIISIGPDDPIKGSLDAGPGKDVESLKRLRSMLQDVARDKEVVVYCGCCPFDRCPNIRPAFQALNDMGFRNAKLLDIPKNIKVDWLDKGYPVKE